MKTLPGLLAGPALCVFGWSAPTKHRLNNFVIIYIDDMGYGDIGPFGAKGYPTPNLDRMAKQGRLFSDFYVTQAVCSASRAGLMSGSYNVRIGLNGVLNHKANRVVSCRGIIVSIGSRECRRRPDKMGAFFLSQSPSAVHWLRTEAF